MDYTDKNLQKVLDSHGHIMLSPHFSSKEMTHTDTGLDNWPDSVAVLKNLRVLCIKVLEPIRKHYAHQVVVLSAFRSLKVNTRIKGSTKSQHMRGEAADIHVRGVKNVDLANWISANLVFDQVILENYVAGEAASGWVHVSFNPANSQRGVKLTKFKGRSEYVWGIHAR